MFVSIISNRQRLVALAIAGAFLAGASAPSWAAGKPRAGASSGYYPTYQSEGGCWDDQGNGRVVQCTN
jgi:hypothetical protein